MHCKRQLHVDHFEGSKEHIPCHSAVKSTPHLECHQTGFGVMPEADARLIRVELQGGHLVGRKDDEIFPLGFVGEASDDLFRQGSIVEDKEEGSIDGTQRTGDIDVVEVLDVEAHVAGEVVHRLGGLGRLVGEGLADRLLHQDVVGEAVALSLGKRLERPIGVDPSIILIPRRLLAL